MTRRALRSLPATGPADVWTVDPLALSLAVFTDAEAAMGIAKAQAPVDIRLVALLRRVRTHALLLAAGHTPEPKRAA